MVVVTTEGVPRRAAALVTASRVLAVRSGSGGGAEAIGGGGEGVVGAAEGIGGGSCVRCSDADPRSTDADPLRSHEIADRTSTSAIPCMTDARTLAENASRPAGEAHGRHVQPRSPSSDLMGRPWTGLRRLEDADRRTKNGRRRAGTPRSRHERALSRYAGARLPRGDTAPAFQQSAFPSGVLAPAFGEPMLLARVRGVLASGPRVFTRTKRFAAASARGPPTGPSWSRAGTARSPNEVAASPR